MFSQWMCAVGLASGAGSHTGGQGCGALYDSAALGGGFLPQMVPTPSLRSAASDAMGPQSPSLDAGSAVSSSSMNV